MRKVLTIVGLLVLGIGVVLPARAQAMDLTTTGTAGMDACAMQTMPGGSADMTSIQSLRDCVVHCYQMGQITSKGVEWSLLKLVDVAQAAENRGQTAMAVRLLNAFTALVKAQSGVSIDSTHADCLIMHAKMVVAALGRR